MKLLIVDDHAVVRAGLKQILSAISPQPAIGEADNAQSALDQLKEAAWDMLLLDISLPDINGINLLKVVKSEWPDLPVLILSIFPEDQYAIRAIKSGANGYMTKESAPEELIHAIKKVAKGGRYITPDLAEKLAFALDDISDKHSHEALSDREYEVMCLIASGNTVSHIARQLNLSVKTVSTYRTRVLAKLKLANNAELTHYAIKQGLIE